MLGDRCKTPRISSRCIVEDEHLRLAHRLASAFGQHPGPNWFRDRKDPHPINPLADPSRRVIGASRRPASTAALRSRCSAARMRGSGCCAMQNGSTARLTRSRPSRIRASEGRPAEQQRRGHVGRDRRQVADAGKTPAPGAIDAARLRIAKLIECHGAGAKFPDLRAVLAQDCPRVGATSIYDRRDRGGDRPLR